MSTHWKAETRDHHRLLWCQDCPFIKVTVGGLVSHTLAGKHTHSRVTRGHEVVVINLITLTEEHRYKMVIPDQPELPPF